MVQANDLVLIRKPRENVRIEARKGVLELKIKFNSENPAKGTERETVSGPLYRNGSKCSSS